MKRASVGPAHVRVLGDALERKLREEAPADGQSASRARRKDQALHRIVQANILANERRHKPDSGIGISLNRRQKRCALKALEWVASRRNIIISQLADGFTSEALEKRRARPRGVLSPAEVRLYDATYHEEAAAISSQACATWRAIEGEASQPIPPASAETIPLVPVANIPTPALSEGNASALVASTSLPLVSVHRS